MLRVILSALLVCPLALFAKDPGGKGHPRLNPQELRQNAEEIYVCDFVLRDDGWKLRVKEVLLSSKSEKAGLIGTLITPHLKVRPEFSPYAAPACIHIAFKESFVRERGGKPAFDRLVPGGLLPNGEYSEALKSQIRSFVSPELAEPAKEPAGWAHARRAQAAPAQDREPKAISMEAPDYPRALKSKGVTGVVNVECQIGVDGSVVSAQAVSSPDPRLSLLAEKAAKKWKFSPGLRQGEPVACTLRIPVSFSVD